MSTRSRTHALALALSIAAAGAGAAMAQTAYLVRDIDAHDHRLDRFFNPDRFFAAGTKVLFTALQKGSDRALWASDGTAGGTELLAYGCPGFCKGELSALATPGPISFFVLHATAGGPPYSQLWRSDGTRSGTFQLTPDAPR